MIAYLIAQQAMKLGATMTLNIQDKPFFNFQETAEILGKNKSTISRWHKSGVFSADKDDATGEFKVSAAEVQRLKDSQKGKGGKKTTKSNSSATVGKNPKISDLKGELQEALHEKEKLEIRLEALTDTNRRLEDDIRERRGKEENYTDQINNLIDTVSRHDRLIEDLTKKELAQKEEKPVEPANENKSRNMTAMVAVAVIALIVGVGGYALYSGQLTVASAKIDAATIEPAAGN